MPEAPNPEHETAQDAMQPEERLRLLGQLAAFVSHEMHNPLNAFSLHADILEEELGETGGGNRQQHLDLLATMRANLMRLYERMQEFLTLIRLSVLSSAPEDVGALLEAFGLEMREVLLARGITLHLEQSPDLGEVKIDQALFHQALRNLISYLADTVPPGGSITLRGHRAEARIQLEVSSPEAALPAEHLAYLFDPFPPARAKGAGLGLYLVHEVVVAHQGQITASGVPDRGTTFTITLPLLSRGTSPEQGGPA
jgi:signal transduction histidine kinase